MGIYGCFGGQQLSKGFVGISSKLLGVHWGVILSGLEAMVMGEMLVGIPSKDASAISVLA